jgi:hypothetical protein
MNLIASPIAVSWMNERTVAMAMSRSRPVCCQIETAMATPTSASAAVT